MMIKNKFNKAESCGKCSFHLKDLNNVSKKPKKTDVSRALQQNEKYTIVLKKNCDYFAHDFYDNHYTKKEDFY